MQKNILLCNWIEYVCVIFSCYEKQLLCGHALIDYVSFVCCDMSENQHRELELDLLIVSIYIALSVFIAL